jgi:hypothetical protein
MDTMPESGDLREYTGKPIIKEKKKNDIEALLPTEDYNNSKTGKYEK